MSKQPPMSIVTRVALWVAAATFLFIGGFLLLLKSDHYDLEKARQDYKNAVAHLGTLETTLDLKRDEFVYQETHEPAYMHTHWSWNQAMENDWRGVKVILADIDKQKRFIDELKVKANVKTWEWDDKDQMVKLK